MQPLPHHYAVTTTAAPQGDILVNGRGLPTLRTDAPADFDGPGGRWSPEDLLVAAAADCLALTFRGIARASKLEWLAFTADVTGTLDRVDRVMQFTHIDIAARVQILQGGSEALARQIAAKAEATCLITRSLKASVHLDVAIEVVSLAGGSTAA